AARDSAAHDSATGNSTGRGSAVGKTDRPLATSENVGSISPGELLELEGLALAARGDREAEARAALAHALSCKPGARAARRECARLLARAGRPDEAAEVLAPVVSAAGSRDGAREQHELAMIRFDAGDVSGAEQALGAALRAERTRSADLLLDAAEVALAAGE